MRSVSITEAKRTFNQLIEAVIAGESFIVTRYAEPVAIMQPHSQPEKPAQGNSGFLEFIRSLPEPDGSGPSDAELLAGLRTERDSWD